MDTTKSSLMELLLPKKNQEKRGEDFNKLSCLQMYKWIETYSEWSSDSKKKHSGMHRSKWRSMNSVIIKNEESKICF